MTSSKSNSDDYTEWMLSSVEYLQDGIKSSWDYLSSSSSTDNFHNLPANLQQSLNSFMDKLSLHGTLPTFELKSPPPPPPLPSSTSTTAKFINKLSSEIKGHPYITSGILTTTTLGVTYYFFPKTVKAYSISFIKPFRPFIPIQLLPTSDRPKRVTNTVDGGVEIRKEVALVLGADGIGREIAIDLERRGFVVIATVRHPQSVDSLEKTSLKGFMKVLVLDPSESSSVAPFLRSLSTALSLRYPIHSSGDPFSRPSHAIALTSVINCLSVSYNNDEGLCPLEGIETELVRKFIGERSATLVGVLKSILPVMRSMAIRPNAPEGVIISLVPSNTANFSLPFLSLSSASDSSIISILNSLRRELQASKTYNLRSTILETGFFQTPSSSTSTTSSSTSEVDTTPLPHRLSTLYHPALSLLSPSSTSSSLRSPSSIKLLNKQIIAILFYSKGGSLSRIGSGSLTYSLIQYLPNSFTDGILIFRRSVSALVRKFTREGTISSAGGVVGGTGVGDALLNSTTTTTKVTPSPTPIPPPTPTTTTTRASTSSSSSTTTQSRSTSTHDTSSFFGPNINDPKSSSINNENPFLFDELSSSGIESSSSLEEEEEAEADGEESSEESGSGMGSFVGVENSEEGWSQRE